MRRTLLALVAVCAAACNRSPDPLASYRATCEQLATQKQLKTGLTVEECAHQIKENADRNDPNRKAQELVDRLSRLSAQSDGKPVANEVRDSLNQLAALGRPAVPVLLAQLKTSKDSQLRFALSRVLANTCAADCGFGPFDCIVPALLEGMSAERPADERHQAAQDLLTCTGEKFGDDGAAWRKWWSEKSSRTASSR
jgi:hypothetical protein